MCFLSFQQEVDVATQAVFLGVLHFGLEDLHLVWLAYEFELAILKILPTRQKIIIKEYW